MAHTKGEAKTAKSGRKKGTPNKTTRDIRAAFLKHDAALVKALIKLTKSKDETVRLKAIQASLDRGHGKPPQAVEVSGELTITHEQALRELD